MKTVVATKDFADFPVFDSIMSEAFPPEELFLPSDIVKLPNVRLEAYYDDDDTPLGMSISRFYEGVHFLEMFAFDPKHRGRGFVSETIKHLLKQHPDDVFIGYVERPDPSYEDNNQRLSRLNFYKRAGFTFHDLQIRVCGVDFIAIAHGPGADERQKVIDGCIAAAKDLPNILRACHIPFEEYNDVTVEGQYIPMK